MDKKNTVQQNIMLTVMSIISVTFLMTVVSYMLMPKKVEEVIITPKAQEIINKARNITSPQNPPAAATQDEKIVSAVFDQECNIVLTTEKRELNIQTSLGQEGMNTCNTGESYGSISESGRYYAYDDISGGVDSMMKVYFLEYDKSITLGFWGTSTIMDYVFVENDQLIAINGYPGEYSEQYLNVFNVPKIKDEYYKNVDENNYFVPSNLSYHILLELPDTGQDHTYIGYDEISDAEYETEFGIIRTLNSNEALLSQFEPDELVMSNSIRAITPKVAVELVRQKYSRSEEQVAYEADMNWERTSSDEWAVNLLVEGKIKAKTYYVNAMTGNIR